MIGSDLTSRGGIASVVKAYYYANSSSPKPINIDLLKTSYYEDKPKFFEVFIIIRAIFVFLYKMLAGDCHIVHIHSSSHLSFIRKAALAISAKLIFRKIVVFHLHSSRFDEFFMTSGSLSKSFFRFLFNRCDLVLVLCRDWQKKLIEHYGLKNVMVLHNPIHSAKAPRSVTMPFSNQLKVLYLGFLIPSKGIADIILIARKLKTSGISSIKLIIAGKGLMESTLRNEIRTHSLEEVVEFRGWVEGEAKTELLTTSQVFLLPSYNEGMPISILEAMSNGMGILSTRIAGIPELVEHGANGYLFSPGDVDAFFQALLELDKERVKLRDFGERSLAYSESFQAEAILAQLVDIYKSLLSHDLPRAPDHLKKRIVMNEF